MILPLYALLQSVSSAQSQFLDHSSKQHPGLEQISETVYQRLGWVNLL